MNLMSCFYCHKAFALDEFVKHRCPEAKLAKLKQILNFQKDLDMLKYDEFGGR